MSTSPSVSVIVCTYNREEFIQRNLDSFKNQTLPKEDFEIIFVNNNSPDNTESIALNWEKENPSFQFSYHLELNQGHTYARNRGINESRGKYLAFIDDDAFIKPNYCEEIKRFFSQYPDTGVIGGRILPLYTEGKEPDWMNPYLLTLVAALDMGDTPKEFAYRKFPIGANMAYRADMFEKYGDFDVTLGRRGSGLEGGDEKDMILRIQQGGEKIMYAPEVIVDHIIPPSRTTIDYVKGLATGVGTSERKRIRKEGFSEVLYKVYQETIKSAGTLVLATSYLIQGQPKKASILVRFRYWVISGLFSG